MFSLVSEERKGGRGRGKRSTDTPEGGRKRKREEGRKERILHPETTL